jgi:hypothetical protein
VTGSELFGPRAGLAALEPRKALTCTLSTFRPRRIVDAGHLPLDDVVDLNDLWRTGELDAALGEDRHEAMAESLELLL